MDHFDLGREESLDIFEETKKWICLLAPSKQKILNTKEKIISLFVEESILTIEEMWHTFILYMIDYRKFCHENFGFFIDHSPTVKAAKEAYFKKMKSDRDGMKNEKEEKLNDQYSFIYDHLGDETLIKWYGEFPEKYSVEIIKKLQKH